jgi:hypothetical protein
MNFDNVDDKMSYHSLIIYYAMFLMWFHNNKKTFIIKNLWLHELVCHMWVHPL